jgi:non-canonical poly(A) RNA polymerase PAPD5/7
LDAEIRAFFDFCRPTPAEQASRKAVLEQTQALIQQAIKDVLTEPMGSYRSGMAMTTSDLDIRLYSAPEEDGTDGTQAPRHKVRKGLNNKLNQLCHLLRGKRDQEYRLIQFRHARYPLVTAQHAPSGLDIQIVASNDTSEQREIMKRYLDEEPDLFPLYTVIKTMLDVRGLCDVYRGGLGSYSLFMMIVASLKLHEKSPTKSIGDKLLDFLRFYETFDLYKDAIAVEPCMKFKKIFPGHVFTGKTQKAMDNDPVCLRPSFHSDQALTTTINRG